jgi:hypothetical protein
MDIKFAHVWTALEKLKTEIGDDIARNGSLTITLAEDDPGEGKLVSCLTLRCNGSSPPARYDSFVSNTTHDFTMEIFSSADNRPPRLTIVKIRDLVKEGEQK